MSSRLPQHWLGQKNHSRMNTSEESSYREEVLLGNTTWGYSYYPHNYTLAPPLMSDKSGTSKPAACEQVHIAVEVFLITPHYTRALICLDTLIEILNTLLLCFQTFEAQSPEHFTHLPGYISRMKAPFFFYKVTFWVVLWKWFCMPSQVMKDKSHSFLFLCYE